MKPLPDIKPDPKRANYADIDNGLQDIRSGKFTRGETLIANGIRVVVTRFTGKDLLVTYAEAKPVTDQILRAYSQPMDAMEVVDSVNNYLQGIVIEGILTARDLGDADRFREALETAKKYVTDAGPNNRSPADRLVSMIHEMRELGATPRTIIATQEACIEAIGKQALKQRPASKP